jgi:hypothetical protein
VATGDLASIQASAGSGQMVDKCLDGTIQFVVLGFCNTGSDAVEGLWCCLDSSQGIKSIFAVVNTKYNVCSSPYSIYCFLNLDVHCSHGCNVIRVAFRH